MESTLDLYPPGWVKITDRGDAVEVPHGPTYPASVELLDEGVEQLNFTVSVDEEAGVTIEVRASHTVSRSSGTGYHTDIQVMLDKPKLRQLVSYLTFVLGIMDAP